MKPMLSLLRTESENGKPAAFRLLPVVMIAAGSLLAVKGVHFIFDPRFETLAVSTAVAQETGENETAAAGDTAGGEADVEAKTADGGDEGETGAAEKDGAEGGGEKAAAAEGTDSGGADKDILSSTEIEVLERLAERRKQLDKREKALELQEKLLRAAEKKIAERLTEIKAIEERVETSFGKRSKEKSQRFKNLVSMYENMKPKDAARIFNSLEMEVLLSVVQNMNARKMAAVLAKMDSIAAQRLTIELAAIAAGRETDEFGATSELPPVTENEG